MSELSAGTCPHQVKHSPAKYRQGRDETLQVQALRELLNVVKSIKLSMEVMSQNVAELNHNTALMLQHVQPLAIVGTVTQQGPTASQIDATSGAQLSAQNRIGLVNPEFSQTEEETGARQDPIMSPADNPNGDDSMGANEWLSPWEIAMYERRCASHKDSRECEKIQVELGFIAHLGVVGGDEKAIETADSVRKELLDFVQFMEIVLKASTDEREKAMDNADHSILRLGELVDQLDNSFLFASGPGLWRWTHCIRNGCQQIRSLRIDGKHADCLKYIHDDLLSDLEISMNDVAEAILRVKEKLINEWLPEYISPAMRKSRLSRVFARINLNEVTSVWPGPDKIINFGERCGEHRRACNAMRDELDHLTIHYGLIGGDKHAVRAANTLCGNLLDPINRLEVLLAARPGGRQKALVAAILSFSEVCFAVNTLQRCLYHKRHLFYFRHVRQWLACLYTGLYKTIDFVISSKPVKCLEFICVDLFSDLESKMLLVAVELQSFGEKILPTSLSDTLERDESRYNNNTSIAAFFTSVTATTLQFSLPQSNTTLGAVVNFFWFVSIVFGVFSSLCGSMLGATWRSSSIYDSRVPPRLVRMLLDNSGPRVFLLISAVTFVIGLNLFTYLSLQARFVSLATNVFTVLLGTCLLVVTTWFINQLKYESIWVMWMRILPRCISNLLSLISGRWIWRRIWALRSDHRLHYLRNFYWAFGCNSRVARLNLKIYWNDWERDWPGPYLISRLIRHIASTKKKCWLTLRKALSTLGVSLLKLIHPVSREGPAQNDIEIGEREHPNGAGPSQSEIIGARAEEAKSSYHNALRRMFGEEDLEIMSDISKWESGEYDDVTMESVLRRRLWGYPELLQEFRETVKPILALLREEDMQIGAERRESGASEDTNEIHPPPRDIQLQDEIDMGGISPQVNVDGRDTPDVSSASQASAHSNDQPESRLQVDDPPFQSDEDQLSAKRSDTMQSLDTAGSLQPASLRTAEGSNTRTEIEEVPGTALEISDRESSEQEEKLEW